MRLLLDTHVFLWWLRDDRRLSRGARAAISATTASVLVSAASIWEIAIKISLRKLEWKSARSVTLEDSIAACGFEELAVTALHAAGVRALPHHHRDPFDRILVAQALAEGARIVSADAALAKYVVPVVAADG
ncbi:MAG: type II toxin-antitoxin system VapC family toxin [Candidatus Binatia bacterium]